MRRTYALHCAFAAIAVLVGVTSMAVRPGSDAGAAAGTALPAERIVTQPAAVSTEAAGTPAPDHARGVVWTGLEPRGASCTHGYALQGVPDLCTHGPDASEPGFDVRRKRGTSELVAATAEGAASTASSAVPCYGNGSDGPRVQVVYAHAADVPDRFSSLATSLATWAGNTDAVFNESAQQTGGQRHVRWVTDAACNLVIERVELSTIGDDSFTTTVSELKSVGFNRADRKYLVWVDATYYCGISTLYNDDSPAQTNASNTKVGFARVDSGCWGLSRPTEAHELMHMLGGVQYTAPHTTGGGHCTDEYDRMCYTDAQGVALTYPCASISHERLFDCNHDDYFSTNPPSGSYLATHWNTASSAFLEAAAPLSWSPAVPTTTTSTTTTSTTPTTSTTVAPQTAPPSVTTSWSGTLNRKTTSRAYSVSSGAGTLTATLSFTKASSLTITLRRIDGSVIASQTGASPVRLSTTVAAGTYSLVVSGGTNGSYSLGVTYPGS